MTSSVSTPSRRKHLTKHGTPADLLGFRRSRRHWKLHPRGQPSRGIRPPPGTTTKSHPGPKFLIQTFKQPIDPSLRKPSNPTASARRSELSLLATRARPTTHARGPATHTRPSAADNLALENRRGRRECRVTTSPMARLQQKTQAAVTTGRAGSAGIPCAMVLRFISRSPR
jgi:hypothetical protein